MKDAIYTDYEMWIHWFQGSFGGRDYAKHVADKTNKQILSETTIFQDFVRVVGRERKINKILKEDE